MSVERDCARTLYVRFIDYSEMYEINYILMLSVKSGAYRVYPSPRVVCGLCGVCAARIYISRERAPWDACRLSSVVKNWHDLVILIVHRTRELEEYTHTTPYERRPGEGATGAADRRPASILEA